MKGWQDTVVLWSKSSTLDRKVEGSNPVAAKYLPIFSLLCQNCHFFAQQIKDQPPICKFSS